MKPADLSIAEAIEQFALDLRIDRSPKTIETYVSASQAFQKWASSAGCGTELRKMEATHIRDWLVDYRAKGRTESSLFNRYNGVRALFTWATAEGLIDENPALKVPAPRPQVKPIPILSLEQLRALLAAAEGTGFEQIRDTALIRLLADTGMRRQECAGLREADLDFEQEIAVVTGKGNRVRACPFGPKTARALRRYLRVKPAAPELWIGKRGPLKPDALLHILRRRARKAGIGRIFVHQLRHTWAHEALRSGLQEGDVMRLGGWRDRDMLGRYGAAGADERARSAYRPVSLGDRL